MPDHEIAKIRVSPDQVAGAEPFELCMWVEIFIRTAVNEQGYEYHELPPDAREFAELWTCYSEWLNGGYAHYHADTEFDPTIWERVSSLLGAMCLTQFKSVFDDFRVFAADNADRIRALYENDQPLVAINLFEDLDNRFRRLDSEGKSFRLQVRDWLVRQDWIVVDPSAPAFTMEGIRQSIAAHPLRQGRLDMRRRKRIEESQ